MVACCRGTFATQRTPKDWQGAVNGAPSLWQRLQRQAENALDLYVKNTANTNVILWGGRLLALFEVRRLPVGSCVALIPLTGMLSEAASVVTQGPDVTC